MPGGLWKPFEVTLGALQALGALALCADSLGVLGPKAMTRGPSCPHPLPGYGALPWVTLLGLPPPSLPFSAPWVSLPGGCSLCPQHVLSTPQDPRLCCGVLLFSPGEDSGVLPVELYGGATISPMVRQGDAAGVCVRCAPQSTASALAGGAGVVRLHLKQHLHSRWRQ